MESSLLRFAAGDTVYQTGDRADCAYIILGGRVALFHGRAQAEDVDRAPLAELQIGDLLGEDGLISEKPRNRDAIALEATTLRRIDGSTLSETVREDPDSAVIVLRAMLERLRGDKRLRPRPGQKRIQLTALTPESEAALGNHEQSIQALPCRIGRLSEEHIGLNEIQLKDEKPFQVSRTHLVICEEGGKVVIYDRGSSLGTWIRGQCLGGPSAFDGPIIVGEEPCELTLGHNDSPIRFSIKLVRS